MKTMKYGRLKSIQFKISAGELFNLLKKVGEIPDGFYIDSEPENYTEWPIQLDVKHITIDNAENANEAEPGERP